MLKVRAASIRDLGKVEQIHLEAGGAARSGTPLARLWTLFSHTLSSLVPIYQESLIYVAEEDGKLVAFVQASSQSPRINLGAATGLQVLNLSVKPGHHPDEVAPPLIDHLCNQALGRGVHRLFVRLPLDDPLTRIFRIEGFHQYATEHVLYSESPRALTESPPPGDRPVRSRDVRLLYHLYRKVTPAGVAQVEAPTFREWRSLKGDWLGRMSTRGDGQQQRVLDRVELVGWLRAQIGASTQPHSLAFLALPEEAVPGELADLALSLVGAGPAWCSLRHYDAHMIDALRGRGFTTLLTQSLMVREMAVRVPLQEKGFVPSFG
ncbi:MAG: hypothetical protein ACREPA_11330 [Candidatus Dormibacteraceae bacterium]